MERKPVCNITVTISLLIGALCAGLAFPSPVHAQSQEVTEDKYWAEATGGMVAADHPLASQVGADILQGGGNAADAAVGTLLTLGVVNPFGSGLGGGGFCLVRPVDGEVNVIDFRERAPKKADRDMYIRDGKADISLTMRGGLAVGVPGEARGLEALHQKYGKSKWSFVVKPARQLAQSGFEVGRLLPKRLARMGDKIGADSPMGRVYRRGDGWVKAGDQLKRPRLAAALRLLENEGAKPFYEGAIADAIVVSVNEADGVFQKDDLKDYRVTWREPLVGQYRGFEVFAMPPPSSGGTTILQALNILERYDLGTLGRNPESLHRITEALKHAFADRATWLGDADFVEVPVSRLVSQEYADGLVVKPNATLATEEYGTSAQLPEDAGTSHVSIIDGDGNMVACTSTINTSFGSLVYVEEFGMVLNNEMGDFTAQPGVPNNYGLMGTEQNAVAPGKRPLSSMSPTLVTKDGEPYMSVGASGGPTIITGTLAAIIRAVDWQWPAADIVSRPRIHHQWLPAKLFAEELPESWVAVLRERGHNVAVRGGYTSVQMVIRNADGTLVGASDPRKMGQPAGVAKKK